MWRRNLLTDYKELLKPQSVKLGDVRAVNGVGTGNVKIVMFVENDRVKVKTTLQKVLLVPDMSCS